MGNTCPAHYIQHIYPMHSPIQTNCPCAHQYTNYANLPLHNTLRNSRYDTYAGRGHIYLYGSAQIPSHV